MTDNKYAAIGYPHINTPEKDRVPFYESARYREELTSALENGYTEIRFRELIEELCDTPPANINRFWLMQDYRAACGFPYRPAPGD